MGAEEEDEEEEERALRSRGRVALRSGSGEPARGTPHLPRPEGHRSGFIPTPARGRRGGASREDRLKSGRAPKKAQIGRVVDGGALCE